MVVSQGGEMVMVPNVEAILEDFAILGESLVWTVEAQSLRNNLWMNNRILDFWSKVSVVGPPPSLHIDPPQRA